MSVVITVFNERASIERLLDSLLHSDPMPGEIVIVDGGSTDGTIQVLNAATRGFVEKGCRLRVLERPGVGIAQGRNIGIREADDEVVAITDGGCEVEPHWYGLITRPLRTGDAEVVGGHFVPQVENVFESVVASLTTTDRPPPDFIPSSRSIAFLRSLFEAVGGYPEHLKWGEDTRFAEEAIARSGRYRVVGEARVRWRVRSTWRSVFRQFHQYARGDGEAPNLRRSVILNQVWGWVVLLAALFGWWRIGAGVLVGYPAVLVLRRSGRIAMRNWGLAWLVSLVIQCARFTGFVRGSMARLTGRRG